MTRSEQNAHNQLIIDLIRNGEKCNYRVPSYKAVVQKLNDRDLKTTRGNPWTRKSLFRMLQRQGISGLHGLLR